MKRAHLVGLTFGGTGSSGAYPWKLIRPEKDLAPGEAPPEKLDRTPAPRFHAFTREAWFLLWEAYSLFVAAFRTAATKLKAGDRAAPFPTGSFLPALPYVAA